MHVTNHHSPNELHTLYRTTVDARVARRIHAVWLARRGLTCQEIMDVTGAARRTVQQWVAKYNRGSLAELLDKPRVGRPSLLNGRQQTRLARHIEAGPTRGLTAGAAADLVERDFGVLYSRRGIQRLLGRLGFFYQHPRRSRESPDLNAHAPGTGSAPEGWHTPPLSRAIRAE